MAPNSEMTTTTGNGMEVPVFLNVYEKPVLLNGCMDMLGLGIYHTAIQVYGVEYAFGSHGKSTSGIYPVEPRQDELLPECFKFRESILLGYTRLTKQEVRRVITQLGRQFCGNAYHVLNKNCNTFSSNLARILCDREPPSWINRTAWLVSILPFTAWILTGKGCRAG